MLQPRRSADRGPIRRESFARLAQALAARFRRHEDRAVMTAADTVLAFVDGSPSCVIVKSERAAHAILRQEFHSLGVTVPRIIRCAKHNKAVPSGAQTLLATRQISVPELEVTAKAIWPVVIQEQKGVHASLEAVPPVCVEVGVEA